MGPLLVFDFDHTITDLNTDVEVQKLAPGGEIPASSEIRGLYSDQGWTEFMGAVFKHLHENSVTKVRIKIIVIDMKRPLVSFLFLVRLLCCLMSNEKRL